MSILKLGPIADEKPVRLTVRVTAQLHRMLLDYAAIHSKQTGREIAIDQLVPAMLERFVASDRAFARERTKRPQRTAASTGES